MMSSNMMINNVNPAQAYHMQPQPQPQFYNPMPQMGGYYMVSQPYGMAHTQPTVPMAYQQPPQIVVSQMVPVPQQQPLQPQAQDLNNMVKNGTNSRTPSIVSANTNISASSSSSTSNSASSSTSTTQLPSFKAVLNKSMDSTSVPTSSPNITSHIRAPSPSAGVSSSNSSPSTAPIMLPPIGFSNAAHPNTNYIPQGTVSYIPYNQASPLQQQQPNMMPHLPSLSGQYAPQQPQQPQQQLVTLTAKPLPPNNVSSLMNTDKQPVTSSSNNHTSPLASRNSMNNVKKEFSFMGPTPANQRPINATNINTSVIRDLLKKPSPKTGPIAITATNMSGTTTTTKKPKQLIERSISPGISPTRKRRRTTKEQRQILKDAFNRNKAPSKQERLDLAARCNMTEKSIQVWFQNQRQYIRREQNLRALQYFQIIN